MKYVVIGVTMEAGNKLELPIIFPDILVHKEVAEQMRRVMRKTFSKMQSAEAVSAGFCNSAGLEPDCHGKSDSIGMPSRGRVDDALIMMSDYGSMHV